MERPLGIMLYREEKKDICYTELKTITDNTSMKNVLPAIHWVYIYERYIIEHKFQRSNGRRKLSNSYYASTAYRKVCYAGFLEAFFTNTM